MNELKDTGVLCNVDKPTLEQTADCLSKIRQADEIINQEGIMVESMDRYGNISAKELARRCKISVQTVYYLENGLQTPTRFTRQKIMNVIENK